MESIMEYFSSIQINFDSFWKAALILLLGTFLLSVLGRFVFGKRSALSLAVSSAIGILFIYAVTVVLKSAGAQFSQLIAPLPFVTISGNDLVLFSFTGAHYTDICSEVLSMIILSFLVNLADGWLPRGKKLFSWLFFRCLTVVTGRYMAVCHIPARRHCYLCANHFAGPTDPSASDRVFENSCRCASKHCKPDHRRAVHLLLCNCNWQTNHKGRADYGYSQRHCRWFAIHWCACHLHRQLRSYGIRTTADPFDHSLVHRMQIFLIAYPTSTTWGFC